MSDNLRPLNLTQLTDARDENCAKFRSLAIKRTKQLIDKVFPGAVDTEKGPALEETCIYSVSNYKFGKKEFRI